MKAATGALAAFLGLAGAAEAGLETVQWDYRPLLLFTPSGDDARLSRQTTMLAEVARGLTERRLAIYIVEDARVFTTFGAPAVGVDAKSLRRRFRVPDDAFLVVLIGLDGGEKLRRDTPLSTETLFGVIDAMPMRRRELRDSEGGG